MTSTIRRVIGTVSLLAAAFLTAAAQEMPKTTKEIIKGKTTVTTEKASGIVLKAEGNTLVVRMSTGDVKEFVVPSDRKFLIDGKELSVTELKPGTMLQATIKTTMTPVTERTTTIGTGTVWFVTGNNVIVTLPNGENRQFTVDSNFHFLIGDEQVSVHDLRKGMKISAEKIVEAPAAELSRDTVVTGRAPGVPKPKTE